MIRPSALGDVVRTVPVLVSLRRAFQGARIDWLVQDAFTAGVSAHPALTSVVAFPRKSLGSSLARLQIGAARRFLRSLREARYDLVFDLQGLARSGLFAWVTRAPRRVGFRNARELGWLGVNERHTVDEGLHSVDRMLGLVKAAGIESVADMRLYAPERDRAELARDGELAGKRYAVVAPTSRWAGKRWPDERFAELCAQMTRMGYEKVVLVGSSSERGQCAAVVRTAEGSGGRVVDRIGKTTVGGLMALIEGAALVVANDSAALHMAVGFSRPLIALYGPTRVELVGPYGREQDVIQHVREGDVMDHKDEGAGREMMERIGVGEVVERVREVAKLSG